jgi:hypothetical protein
MGSTAVADETFIPKGFLYRPGDTRMPAINSWRYKIITEADRRESEIYTSKKLESDFQDYMIHNLQREQNAPRAGWRYY